MEKIPPEVLEDLYEYPRKRRLVARLLWLVLGVFGGHRLYLNRVWTGILMLLTLGGLLVWWVVDAFLLRGMVERHNEEQAERKVEGLPPVSLSFLPASDGSELAQRPAWDDPRARSGVRGAVRLLADALVLALAGVGLGAASRGTGNVEAVTAVAVLILVLNFGHRLAPLHHVPLVGDLVRWSYRLKLFYHHVRPGNAISRFFRPVIGFIFAPFRKKARAEVGLYLRLGGAFVVLFLLEDLASEVVTPIVARADLSGLTGTWWLGDVVMTLIAIYAFAAPIGATLMIYLLTRRSHLAVGGLSALTAAAMVAGFLSF